MKVYIDKVHQVRVMVKLLAISEANSAGDRETAYENLRSLLNMLDISDEARKEAHRQHKERCDRGDFDFLKNKIEQLKTDILAKLEPAGTTTPPLAPTAPEPTPTAPAAKLPTKRMRKSIEQFDAMTDGEQIKALREMGW